MEDDKDILHKTLMVEAEFFSGENEDKPHRTLMVKAQKKICRKIKTYLKTLMAKVESLMETQ